MEGSNSEWTAKPRQSHSAISCMPSTNKYLVIDLRSKHCFEPGSTLKTRLVLSPLHPGDETGRTYEGLGTAGVLSVQERMSSEPINAMGKDMMNMTMSSMVWRNHKNVLTIL